jgi:maltooligosyltrehalose trehalohydrolase
MTSQPHGWWQAEVPGAHHGTDYGFVLDDDPKPYPDPRSAWQPNGVHGLSRVLDQSRYQWTDAAWKPGPLSNAVIYELHIGTFTPEGTFEAAVKKLPQLRDLGITHVELMPVNSFPGRWGWGYDGVELFAPQEQYGGPDGLKQLVDACHSLGLAALLDVVYNHFGPDGNYTGRFAPYITENHHTPWGGAVNLEEGGSDEVRRFFCDNALMWLRDYHFDGLRLDAVHSLVDRSAKHFLEQLAEEVDDLSEQVDRELVLIAESDLNDPRLVTPRNAEDHNGGSGYGLDAQWSDDFHHALFALITDERQSYYSDFGNLSQLAKALSTAYVFDGDYSEYRGRNHGRPVQDLSAHRFLGYIQNHDQVGNRALGDRLPAIVGTRLSRVAAAMVLTAPFVPMIFQGEEFAASSPFLYFADHSDPALRKAVTEGRRREHAPQGGWNSIPDPEAQETFEKSKLNWAELTESEHAAMFSWYRDLISLRGTHPELTDEDLANTHVRFDETAKWLVMNRGQLSLFFNFSDLPVTIAAPHSAALQLASDEAIHLDESNIQLPPQSFAATKSPS